MWGQSKLGHTSLYIKEIYRTQTVVCRQINKVQCGGGSRRGGNTPPPPFRGPPNFIKREINVACMHAKTPHFSSYLDPFPKSCIRPCVTTPRSFVSPFSVHITLHLYIDFNTHTQRSCSILRFGNNSGFCE